MWAWPPAPHFCHLGYGSSQKLVHLLDTDAKASRRQLHGITHDQHILTFQLPVGVLATHSRGEERAFNTDELIMTATAAMLMP